MMERSEPPKADPLEAAARDSRLPPFDMSPSETSAFPHHREYLAEYCMVRNALLARWLENPRVRLTLEDAMSEFPAREAMVRDIHTFLELNCYINFGLLPLPPSSTGLRIVVIGAGVAGLAAARQLRLMGARVTVFEARNRPGGRVTSYPLSGDGEVTLCDGTRYQKGVDLGASIITGLYNGNPLLVLSRQMGLEMHEVGGDVCPLFLPTGAELDPEVDKLVDVRFNSMLERTSQMRSSLKADVSLAVALETLEATEAPLPPATSRDAETALAWHKANLEFANATTLDAISLMHWDQDDQYELMGKHLMISNGYAQVPVAMAAGLDVRYQSLVTRIEYSATAAMVYLQGGQAFPADKVIVAVPLGVLKASAITFSPPMPTSKAGAIERLGFGVLNKTALRFDKPFWTSTPTPERFQVFGLMSPPERRGLHFLVLNVTHLLDAPTLLLLTSGKAAVEFEKMPQEEAVKTAMDALRTVFGPNIPEPIDHTSTRWGMDPYARGSYSSIPPGASGSDYDLLAAPLLKTVFFAGEATNRYYPATVHGAILSGLREASRVIQTVQRPTYSQLVPQPGNFTRSLRCQWGTCSVELGPTDRLLDHFLMAHLTHEQRLDYFSIMGREKFKSVAAVQAEHARLASKRVSAQTDEVLLASLLPKEQEVCRAGRIPASVFVHIRNALIATIQKHGPLNKTEARVQSNLKVDVNRIAKVYDYLVAESIIPPKAAKRKQSPAASGGENEGGESTPKRALVGKEPTAGAAARPRPSDEELDEVALL